MTDTKVTALGSTIACPMASKRNKACCQRPRQDNSQLQNWMTFPLYLLLTQPKDHKIKVWALSNTHSTSPAEFTHPQWRELPLSCRFGSKQRYSKASGECAEAFFYIDSQKDMQRWEKSEPSVTGESTQIEHKYEGGTPQRGLQEFAHSRLPSETLILAIVTSKVHVRNDTDEPTIWSTHVSENAIWHHICEHKKLVRKTTLDKSHSLLKASSPHFKATSVQRRSLFPASE